MDAHLDKIGQNATVDANRASRRRRYRILASGTLGGAAAIAVASSGGGAGLPFADVALASALAAAIGAFPRVLVGTLAGVAIALVVARDGSGWDRWRDGIRVVTWASLLGAVTYSSRWGLDLLIDIRRSTSSALGRSVRSVRAAWTRSADARRHPLTWLRRRVGRLRAFLRSEREQLEFADPPWPRLNKHRDIILFLVAAALYALARLGTDRFYARFEVSAEEAGITTPSLLLSAAGAIAVLVVAVGATAWALRTTMRVSATRLILFVSLGSAIGVSGAGAPNWGDGLIGLFIGVVAWWFTADTQIGRRRPGRRTWSTLSAFSLLLAIVATIEVSDTSAERVQAGLRSNPSIGPFMVTPLHAPVLSVWAIGDASLPDGLAEGSCATLLGVANGVAVLHWAGYTWRVPADRLILVDDGCDNDG